MKDVPLAIRPGCRRSSSAPYMPAQGGASQRRCCHAVQASYLVVNKDNIQAQYSRERVACQFAWYALRPLGMRAGGLCEAAQQSTPSVCRTGYLETAQGSEMASIFLRAG